MNGNAFVVFLLWSMKQQKAATDIIKPVGKWTDAEVQHFLWLLNNYRDQINKVPGAKNTSNKGFDVHFSTTQTTIYSLTPNNPNAKGISRKSNLATPGTLEKKLSLPIGDYFPTAYPYPNFDNRIIIKLLGQYNMLETENMMKGEFNNPFLAPLAQFLSTHEM